MHTYVVRRPVGSGNLQRIERSVRLQEEEGVDVLSALSVIYTL